MKNIYSNFLLFIFASIFIVACDDKLDLDPQQNVDTQQALSTSDGVKNFLNGAYAEIAGQLTATLGGELYGCDFNLVSELLGSDGEISWTGTFEEYGDIRLAAIVDNNFVIENNWIRAYDAINICNLVLAHIDVVDEDERDRVQGEALAIRSILFFELVRFYALPYEAGETNSQPGIPIVVDPNVELSDITAEDYVSRDDVETVYNKVITDLNMAVDLLPELNGVKVNKYVALAMLSRIYLQKGDFENARDAANTVIEEGSANVGYQLLPDFTRCFNNQSNTSEDIFAIQQNSLFNAGTSNTGLTTFYANSDQSGRDGDIDILPKHLAIYEDGDVRGQFFYTGVSDGLPKTSKWLVEYANIQVIRLAEMYLTRAECNFRLGTAVGNEPVDDINIIRNRAELGDLDEVDLTLDEIFLERRRELAFEGLRLHDMKRFHKDVDGLSYDDPDLVLPLPRREKENNTNLGG